MSDFEDFEVVDEMGEKVEPKIENSQSSTISNDTFDKTKSVFDKISNLFEIENGATSKMFELNKTNFDNIIEKIDSFSEKMINLINDRRNKVKESDYKTYHSHFCIQRSQKVCFSRPTHSNRANSDVFFLPRVKIRKMLSYDVNFDYINLI